LQVVLTLMARLTPCRRRETLHRILAAAESGKSGGYFAHHQHQLPAGRYHPMGRRRVTSVLGRDKMPSRRLDRVADDMLLPDFY